MLYFHNDKQNTDNDISNFNANNDSYKSDYSDNNNHVRFYCNCILVACAAK